MEANNVTIKSLSEIIGMEPKVIRKVLRKANIKPKLVAVPEGWPGQLRREYLWESDDPELRRVFNVIKAEAAKLSFASR